MPKIQTSAFSKNKATELIDLTEIILPSSAWSDQFFTLFIEGEICTEPLKKSGDFKWVSTKFSPVCTFVWTEDFLTMGEKLLDGSGERNLFWLNSWNVARPDKHCLGQSVAPHVKLNYYWQVCLPAWSIL